MQQSAPSTIVEAIFDTAARRADDLALICGGDSSAGPEAGSGQRITYGTLATKIASAAALLRAGGVNPGDRVLLGASSAGPAFVYGYFACHHLGAIAVPVEPRIGAVTLAAVVEQTRPRLRFLDAGPLDCDRSDRSDRS